MCTLFGTLFITRIEEKESVNDIERGKTFAGTQSTTFWLRIVLYTATDLFHAGLLGWRISIQKPNVPIPWGLGPFTITGC